MHGVSRRGRDISAGRGPPGPSQQARRWRGFAPTSPGLPCQIAVRYDVYSKRAAHIEYAHDGATNCEAGHVTAITAAVGSFPAEGFFRRWDEVPETGASGEPALPAMFACEILVSYTPASAGTPALHTHHLAFSCVETHRAVMLFAVQAVRCTHQKGVACPF